MARWKVEVIIERTVEVEVEVEEAADPYAAVYAGMDKARATPGLLREGEYVGGGHRRGGGSAGPFTVTLHGIEKTFEYADKDVSGPWTIAVFINRTVDFEVEAPDGRAAVDLASDKAHAAPGLLQEGDRIGGADTNGPIDERG